MSFRECRRNRSRTERGVILTTAPAPYSVKIDSPFSRYLSPDFATDLMQSAKEYDRAEEVSDNEKWVIAELVNDMWSEHAGLVYELTGEKVFPTKAEYYVECSRVANIGLSRKRFGDSGETLRAWCELQQTYAAFPDIHKFLDALSFEHLRKAKKLAKDEKVKVPVLALAKAIQENWTADEMKEHYDPSEPVHPYEKVTSWLDGMLNKESWSWLKSPKTIKDILFHAAEIKRLIAEDS